MSEQLSPYEFAQLLVDISLKERAGPGKVFVMPLFEFDTYDVSERGKIMFNEDSEEDVLHLSTDDKMIRDDWPFNGEKNE